MFSSARASSETSRALPLSVHEVPAVPPLYPLRQSVHKTSSSSRASLPGASSFQERVGLRQKQPGGSSQQRPGVGRTLWKAGTVGEGPVSPGARSNMPLTRVIASGEACPDLPFPVKTMTGLCPPWRARAATLPPLAGVSSFPVPVPSLYFSLNSPVPSSGVVASKEPLHPRESVGENSHRAVPARGRTRKEHGSSQRNLARYGTVVAVAATRCGGVVFLRSYRSRHWRGPQPRRLGPTPRTVPLLVSPGEPGL